MNGPDWDVPSENPEGADEPPAPSRPSPRQSLGLGTTMLGILVAATACACGPLSAVLPAAPGVTSPDGVLIQQALAMTLLGGGLGLVLIVVGWRAWRNLGAPPFHPRRFWLLAALLLPLLLLGVTISLFDTSPTVLLSLVNTATMALLPALILAMVGQALAGSAGSWNDVLGGVASGASLGTGTAVVIELLVVVVLVSIAMLVGLLPSDTQTLETLQEQLTAPNLFDNPQTLLDLLSPALVGGVVLFVAIITPLIEELTKTLGIGLAGRWLQPTPPRAFLLGVASGAGFALAENLFNGALISPIWGPAIVSRLAATLMHCATSGLMGWGWGQLWTARRPARLALAFAVAVVIHGIWNGMAIGAAVSGLFAAGNPEDLTTLAFSGLMVLAAIVVLGIMTVAALTGILWAARALARQETV